MSSKLNITPGEVYTTVQDPAFPNFEIRLRDDDMRLVATMGIDCSPEEEAANATLYADAHNTYRSCQMLPSELLDRVKELEGALSGAIGETDDWWCPVCKEALGGNRVTFQECCDTCGTFLGYQTPEYIENARTLLSKRTTP